MTAFIGAIVSSFRTLPFHPEVVLLDRSAHLPIHRGQILQLGLSFGNGAVVVTLSLQAWIRRCSLGQEVGH